MCLASIFIYISKLSVRISLFTTVYFSLFWNVYICNPSIFMKISAILAKQVFKPAAEIVTRRNKLEDQT